MLPLKTRMRHCASWCPVKHLGFPQLHSIIEIANCFSCMVIVFPGSACITETTDHQLQIPAYLTWVSLVYRRPSLRSQKEVSSPGQRQRSGAEVMVPADMRLSLNHLVLPPQESESFCEGNWRISLSPEPRPQTQMLRAECRGSQDSRSYKS